MDWVGEWAELCQRHLALYDFQNDWRVRIGQFRIHFNREESTPAGHQLAVERSLLNEAINLGRTQGLEFTWTRGRNMLTFTTGDGATDPALQNGLRQVYQNPADQTSPEPLNQNALNPDVEWFLAGKMGASSLWELEPIPRHDKPYGFDAWCYVGLGDSRAER